MFRHSFVEQVDMEETKLEAFALAEDTIKFSEFLKAKAYELQKELSGGRRNPTEG